MTYGQMLTKSDGCTMEVGRLKNLCIEIYKTLNGLNPLHMKYIFQKPINRTSKRLRHNICSAKHYQVNFGTRSLRVLGHQFWNKLPENIKCADTLQIFKRLIKGFQGFENNQV